MIPQGFKVKRISNTSYTIVGKISPILPGFKAIPCQISRMLHYPEIQVYIKVPKGKVPWIPILEELPGNWLRVDIGDGVKDETDALIRTEALINKIRLPGTETALRVTRVKPIKKVRVKEEEAEPKKKVENTLRYKWDGLLLLEVADYVDWNREKREQICYIAGIKHNGTYIPTRFYRVKGQRSSVHVHVDPISQVEVFDHIYDNGLIFLGSCHSQPDSCTEPSSIDLKTMRTFQAHYPSFGCVITPSGVVHFYSPTKPIHVTIDHPRIREVKDGKVFQIQQLK